jgi:hypothetical protein
MGLRLDLQAILEAIIGGSNNVHFQPPASTHLSYPCILYKRSGIESQFGDNIPYFLSKEYTLTVIYKDPDSDLPDRIAKLPKCKSNQMFSVDNLYHAVFKIIF